MLRQLRHDVWATDKLIAHCGSLTPEQLELTVPGTYGSIRKTLLHVVAADERYLSRFMEMPDQVSEKDTPDATLDDLTRHLAAVREAVETLFAGKEFDPDRVIRDERRKIELAAWILVAQFCHHGSDHRAHIGTILGAHGQTVPGLDVWAYGWEIGAGADLS